MDRLAEQVVEWHNRHPLAKRITIYDVHTIGVVALPFMRRGGPTAPGVEPVLSEEVSPESLAQAASDETTIAAHPNAEHLDALADQEPPPPTAQSARTRLQKLLLPLRALTALLPMRIRRAGNPDCWPVFSEAFVPGLSARRVAAFAEEHGYATRPGDDTWPQRVIAVDDALAAQGGGGNEGGGAWPMELYLKSAAIDVGNSRSRVLVGRGGLRPPIVGRRCWNWRRVALVGVLLALLLGLSAWRFWPGRAEKAAAAAAAASAARTASGALAPASGAASAASAPASAAVSAADAASAASEAASGAAASSASAVAATPAPSAATSTASAPLVDIRPQIAMPVIEHTHMGKPVDKAPPLEAASGTTPRPASAPASASGARPGAPAAAPAAASVPSSAGPSVAAPPPTQQQIPVQSPAPRAAPPLMSDANKMAAVGTTPGANPAPTPDQPSAAVPEVTVALVGPASKDQATAEALLKRMLELINDPTAPKPSRPLTARVFKTPEGWRPAVYPFDSREQAQLVNLNLVATGLHTKAVNF